MSAYRFCRTDDIGLLVDALNRCWAPYAPGEPPVSAADFKRSIRDAQVWCSSCMVAFSGSDPVGVLIGAKRPTATLIHRIAVHPDHVRQGHGRHLLDSLSAKLSILGPPRIVAEVPEHLEPACGLFRACGFVEDTVLTDYVRRGDAAVDDADDHETRGAPADASDGTFVIPVTVDDLAANGLLDEADRDVCWTRAAETLTATRADLAGLAIASEERLEAYVLFVARDGQADIVALRSLVDTDGRHLRRLCAALRAMGLDTWRLPKVHPKELSASTLAELGFQPVERHRRYEAHARPA